MKWIIKILKLFGLVFEHREKIISLYVSIEAIIEGVRLQQKRYKDGTISADKLIADFMNFDPTKILEEKQKMYGFADEIAGDLVELALSKKGSK